MPATPPERMNRKPLWMAKIINSIRDFAVQSRITSIMVVPGELNKPAAEMTETPSGTLVKLRIGAGGGESSAQVFPLQVTNASNPTDGAQVRIRYGTIGGSVIDGMNVGDDPVFILPITTTGYVYAAIETTIEEDHGTFTIDTITATNAATVPTNPSIAWDDLSATWYMSIASVVLDGDDVTAVGQVVSGSQEMQLCGADYIFGLI